MRWPEGPPCFLPFSFRFFFPFSSVCSVSFRLSFFLLVPVFCSISFLFFAVFRVSIFLASDFCFLPFSSVIFCFLPFASVFFVVFRLFSAFFRFYRFISRKKPWRHRLLDPICEPRKEGQSIKGTTQHLLGSKPASRKALLGGNVLEPRGHGVAS